MTFLKHHLELIPCGPEHAGVWFTWRQEATTRRFNPLDPLDVPQLAQRLAGLSSDLTDRLQTDYRWMVVHQDTCIGTVALKGVSWRMGYGELAYGIGEAWQGQGYGTQAVALLVDLVFRESDLARLFATISSENTASQKLVERLGFTREGVLREHFVIEGRRVDECVYGLLRREWEAWDILRRELESP